MFVATAPPLRSINSDETSFVFASDEHMDENAVGDVSTREVQQSMVVR